MNDQDILARIQSLVDEEHELRSPGESGVPDEDRPARLRRLEEELDQCWDLLRQRRAKQDAGESPQDAETRPVNQVEGYKQ